MLSLSLGRVEVRAQVLQGDAEAGVVENRGLARNRLPRAVPPDGRLGHADLFGDGFISPAVVFSVFFECVHAQKLHRYNHEVNTATPSSATFPRVVRSRMDNQKAMERAWTLILDKIRDMQVCEPRATYGDIGKMVGRDKATVHRWDKEGYGGEKTSFSDMLNYLSGLGIDLSEVFKDLPESEFEYIRKVKARLGAGSSFVTDPGGEERYAFRRDFLRNMGPVAQLILFQVIGSSMEPDIRHGDTVLVNQAETDPRNGEVFAVRVGKELLVKRIFFEPGFMVCRSDNERGGEFKVSLDGQEDFGIVGKIKWLGRIY